jgi:predicted GNAT family acetyltransferase
MPSGASDGYEAAPEQWVALERQKSETGRLSFHIFSEGDQPVVTTGLIRLPNNVVRIKNFFVRSDQRRRGMGKMSVGHLLQFLSATGEKAAVVLSVEGSIGQRLYNSCGARDIGRIYEWSRPL